MATQILQGDCLKVLKKIADESINCCVTSPPYWNLRDYNTPGQYGLEATPEEYIENMVAVFREVKRVLRKDGLAFINIGDCYVGNGKGGRSKKKLSANWQPEYPKSIKPALLKPKDLVGIPWMLAFALRADGWFLRQEIIWSKPNPMPESAADRFTKAHEQIFMLSKSRRYYFDQESILEPISQNTHLRVSQDVMNRVGSARAHGGAKTNGNMKAAVRKHKNLDPDARDKQHSFHAARVKDNESYNSAMVMPGRRSGNKERKPGTARGCPEGTGSNVCGSIPWEGFMRNKRSVWEVVTRSFKGSHFATYPPDLIKPCILAGCPEDGWVLDPFFGAGTTGLVCDQLKRNCIGIELNPEYIKMAANRIKDDGGMFAEVIL